MDKSLSLSHAPGELNYLIQQWPAMSRDRPHELRIRTDDVRPIPMLTSAASRRLSGLTRRELAAEYSVAHPEWLGGLAVPRLIVTAKYEGQDAFGASRLLADLDLAARRAGALHRQLLRDGQVETWPAPLRTRQGGLHLLGARVGSFDALMTVWGSLVMLASSSPVAVAGMIALAWDVARGSIRIANRWVGAALVASQGPPSLQAPDDAEPWGIQHTKALAPAMNAAIANDQGFEFFLDGDERKIKLTVPPKE